MHPSQDYMRHAHGRAVRCLAALACGLLLAGCAQPDRPALDVAHVHGLAYEAESDTVYMASHHGLARGEREDGRWSWTFVGEPYDFMGFTKDTERAGTFYSSGHPDDPRAYGGVHLGLRRSTDGGETWEQRSLKGEVDFHALAALQGGEGWLAGHWQGKTKVSRDAGGTWTDHPSPPAAVIAFASAEDRLLAGTSNGLYETLDLQSFGDWTRLDGPGQGLVSSVASSRDGMVLLAGTGDGRAGSTYRSADAGKTWIPIEEESLAVAPGQVLFAFDAEDPRHVFAALGDGTLFESKDAGEAWSRAR
ncbi:MAG TPA: hypothetical protein VJ874_03850 [Candidatus Thermoplasmatota archaeon]|nr:hypothetical protein [Candidatus Thermoplasmatota archaeon]